MDHTAKHFKMPWGIGTQRILHRLGNRYQVAKGEEQIMIGQDDNIIRRLRVAAHFMAAIDFKGTRDISILAKVHLLKQGMDVAGTKLQNFIRQRGPVFQLEGTEPVCLEFKAAPKIH